MVSRCEPGPSIASRLNRGALDMVRGGRSKGGRPALAPTARRTRMICFRVTDAEAALVAERATSAEVSVPAFLRRLVLGRPADIAPPSGVFAYAAGLAQLATDLRRLERLALAGRIVGVPVEAVEQLHAILYAQGLAALGIEADGP